MSDDVTAPRGVKLPSGDNSTMAHVPAKVAGPKTLRLEVFEGRDTGATFVMDPAAPSRILIGTSPACEIRLTDPTVSRRHVALEPVSARFRITDLGSKNGTFVDGVAVLDAFLQGGETLRVGSTAIRVDSTEAAERPPVPSAMRFGRVLGASHAMRRLYPLCEKLAKTRVPVLIEGETGTGKENLAESLHAASGTTGPFLVFDCTTVAPGLLEAELFGHERGAFTGAIATRSGVFEQAHGGTLLIDEIGDLDLPLQAKLLRALDRGEVRRVGSNTSIRVEVRILSATRRDLDKEVAAGRFRDDLFHRLAVARIELPPLRDRHGDIALLARQFWQEMGGSPADLTAAVLARFEDSSWPGNVRELRNAVARVLALGDDAEVSSPGGVEESRGRVGSSDWLEALCSGDIPFPIARRKAKDAFERMYVQSLLKKFDGNVSRAAQASGIALRYFQLVKARQKRGE